MRPIHFCLLPFAFSLFAGCAKSPSGAPTTPQGTNRLAVRVDFKKAVNPNFLYSFAFDDDDDATDGPVTLVGPRVAPNGAVGGEFTVLVQLKNGQFIVFRRTGSGRTEQLQPVPQAFVIAPVRSGQTLSFTLNLDATLPDGTRLFRSPETNGIPNSLDINFIAIDRPRIDPNNLLPPAYDSLGPAASASDFELDIRTPRNETNSSLGINEPANDVINPDTSGRVDSDQLDIVDFGIRVERSR